MKDKSYRGHLGIDKARVYETNGKYIIEEKIMKVMSRRERERQEHLKHVLNVAGEMFAKRGFFKVTMKQIAERAEFALGTLYGFFRGKRNLYQQVIERKVDELVTAVSGEMARDTAPILIIKRFIEAKLRFFFENQDFVRLYFAGMQEPPLHGERALSVALHDKYHTLLEKICTAFERGTSDGTFAGASPKALTTAIDGQTDAIIFSWLSGVSPGSPENEIQLAKRIFLNGALIRPGGKDASGMGTGSKEI